MRLWVSRDSAVSMREQLAAQLLLEILSRKLLPGNRPGIRPLARRLKVHANTVSAAYRALAARGWVVYRRGSGVFVSDCRVPDDYIGIESFVRDCINEGLARGFSPDALSIAFANALCSPAPVTRQFLVADPDLALAQIIAAEASAALRVQVRCARTDGKPLKTDDETCLLLNPAHASAIVAALHPRHYRVIELRTMQDLIVGHQRPADAALIGVVSRSPSVLEWAATLLAALGFQPEALVVLNPNHPRWRQGLAICDVVAVDVVSAQEFEEDARLQIFRIVSADFILRLQSLVTVGKVS